MTDSAPLIRTLAVAVAAAVILVAAPARAQEDETGVPSLAAGRLTGAIRIDGLLGEPAWQAAPVASRLRTVEPREGAPPRGATRVRVLADARTIVVGIECDDPDPSGIVAFTKGRDAELRSEDHVRVVFDTFLDGRSGYVFAVNARGARYDALINPGGESDNVNWDGIWQAATARTDHGWSVEIRIPVSTLGFAPGLTTWHFNVERRVQRLQETSRWAGVRRDFRVLQTSRAGLLTDLPAFDLGRGLSVRPAAVGGIGVPVATADAVTKGHVSLDASQRLGSNLLASMTVNTDFAETEVDTRRTNLTRFPLFFPEKRTFFLEGADLFEFGPGAGQDVMPYFSRRIGLVGNRTVPIGGGVKVTGRVGRTQVGALGVHERAGAGVPSAGMAVARVKRNVGAESSVGLIGTVGDPAGAAGSWTFGMDGNFQTSHFMGDKNFSAGGWGLGTSRPGLTGDQAAWGARIDYPNDLWDVNLNVKHIGDLFQPSLGFVPRAGVRMYNLNVEYKPRPQNGWLRQMLHEFRPAIVTDLRGRWESYKLFMAPVNWRFESGDRMELNYNPTGERLDAPFEIVPGVVIAPGAYQWVRKRMEVGLAPKRRVSGQLTYWFGDFYDGRLREYIGTITLNPAPIVTVELSLTRNAAHLRAGAFVQEVAGTRVKFNVSPNLQIASYVQYDNQSRLLGSNSRVRWTFSPVGDFFLIYNHNVHDLGDRWQLDNNQLLVKVQYTVRR